MSILSGLVFWFSANISYSAWDEIHEVFGDGHDYDWALADDEDDYKEEQIKPDMNYQDVGSLFRDALQSCLLVI